MATVYVRWGHALCRLIAGLHVRFIRPLLRLRRSNYGLRLRKRSLWTPNFASPRERDRFLTFWPLLFPLHALIFLVRLAVELGRTGVYWVGHRGRFAEPAMLDDSDPSLCLPPPWTDGDGGAEKDMDPATGPPAPPVEPKAAPPEIGAETRFMKLMLHDVRGVDGHDRAP